MSNKYLCTLYLWILYRCIASKTRFLNRLCHLIARKICLFRQKCRFIAQNQTNCIASSPGKSYYLEICVALSKEFTNLARFISSLVQENFCLVFSIASSVTKMLANKIVSLYSIFFSKIVYLYRFKLFIFEYQKSLGPHTISLEMAHKVICPQKK